MSQSDNNEPTAALPINKVTETKEIPESLTMLAAVSGEAVDTDALLQVDRQMAPLAARGDAARCK